MTPTLELSAAIFRRYSERNEATKAWIESVHPDEEIRSLLADAYIRGRRDERDMRDEVDALLDSTDEPEPEPPIMQTMKIRL